MQITETDTKVAPIMDAAERLRISKQRVQATLAGLHPKQAEYVEKQLPSYQRVLAEAFAGSRAKAVKAKCLTCSNFQKDEIQNCTVITCPLHTVRPYQVSNEEADD